MLDQHKQQADKNMAAEGRWSWIWGSRRRKQPSETIDETATASDEISSMQEDLRQAQEKVSDLEAKIFAEKNQMAQSSVCTKQDQDCSLPFKVREVLSMLSFVV